MNYDAIITSTYKWLSLNKLIWFLLFFWISVPVFLFLPVLLNLNFFAENKLWLVNFLYFVIYFSLIVSFFILTYYCLKKHNHDAKEISITKFFDGVLLIFVQLWYIFVWNIHKSYRTTQLLLLFGLPLLFFYSTYLMNWFVDYAIIIFLFSYFALVIYNWTRTSFSITYFLSHDCSIKDAVKESWHMTHNKFIKIIFAYFVIFVSIFVLFIVYTLLIGAILNLFLLNYFLPKIASELSFIIAGLISVAPVLISYYFAYFELYNQLTLQNLTSKRIKNILARKVLSKEKKVIKKQKKKVSNKSKKKIIKKSKPVKKKKAIKKSNSKNSKK